MPYEFEPRELPSPRSRRQPASVPDPVRAALDRWLSASEDTPRREIGGAVSGELYDLAEDILDGVGVRATDATAAVIARGASVPPEVGLFLSAAYNRTDESVVVYDATLPHGVKHLGFRLPAEKTLVLDGTVASAMGVDASGLVVNRTAIDGYFGYSGSGAFVNASTGSCQTFGSTVAGVSVDLGTVTGTTGSPLLALGGAGEAVERSTEDVAADGPLCRVLTDLDACLTGDREDLHAQLGDVDPSPRIAIEARLREAIDAER